MMFKTKIFLVFTFIILSMFAFAQESNTSNELKKWTFGIILMDEHDPLIEYSFRPHFFNGIVVKRNLNCFSFRLGIEHINYSYERDDFTADIADGGYADGYSRKTEVRFGIEKGITIKKIFKPYIAFDISGSKSYSNMITYGGFSGISYHKYRDTYSIGVNPTIGFDVIITKSFSISLETRLQMLYYDFAERYVNLYNYQGNEYYENSYHHRSLKRIGALTLNYCF